MSEIVELLLRHLEAENDHRLDETLATLTADCEFVDAALGRRWSGHTGAAEHYTMWWTAFETHVTGERLHLADRSAFAETTWRGRHVGPFLHLPPTGRSIELTIGVVVELADGLISAERFYWDRARLAEQLGVEVTALDATALDASLVDGGRS